MNAKELVSEGAFQEAILRLFLGALASEPVALPPSLLTKSHDQPGCARALWCL